MSSSSCHPSAHLILAHLQQLNSQQSPSRLNQLYYQLHPTQLNYRLASLAISDQGPALSLSTQRASASRRRSAQPSPTFLHDSNFIIITVLESRVKVEMSNGGKGGKGGRDRSRSRDRGGRSDRRRSRSKSRSRSRDNRKSRRSPSYRSMSRDREDSRERGRRDRREKKEVSRSRSRS